MTPALALLGFVYLCLLVASRERRARRHAMVRQRRRADRERQWRAMIRDHAEAGLP